MFFGRYERNIDEKNRLMFPSKMQSKLEGTLYMTLGINRCISLYTEEDFEAISKLYSRATDLSKEGLGFKRAFFSNVYECKLDNQGRILMSKELMKITLIKKETIIIGNEDHVEIWDKQSYEQMESVNLENYDSYAEAISLRRSRED